MVNWTAELVWGKNNLGKKTRKKQKKVVYTLNQAIDVGIIHIPVQMLNPGEQGHGQRLVPLRREMGIKLPPETARGPPGLGISHRCYQFFW